MKKVISSSSILTKQLPQFLVLQPNEQQVIVSAAVDGWLHHQIPTGKWQGYTRWLSPFNK